MRKAWEAASPPSRGRSPAAPSRDGAEPRQEGLMARGVRDLGHQPYLPRSAPRSAIWCSEALLQPAQPHLTWCRTHQPANLDCHNCSRDPSVSMMRLSRQDLSPPVGRRHILDSGHVCLTARWEWPAGRRCSRRGAGTAFRRRRIEIRPSRAKEAPLRTAVARILPWADRPSPAGAREGKKSGGRCLRAAVRGNQCTTQVHLRRCACPCRGVDLGARVS